MKIDDYLLRFTRLHPKSIDLSLDRIRRLLHRLGDPQRKVPPVIHVAGTNGKGSTVAYLRAILNAAGRRVHAYTSPHLIRFNERIRLPDGLITDAELEALFDECDHVNGDAPITFFEITTVAALLAFSRHPADYLLLEVGLGGRLDTTNVSETTVLSIITAISYDHQRFLGDTLTDIAGEKAGVMRPGVPVITAPQEAEAAARLERAARDVGAKLYAHGEAWHFDPGPSLSVRLGNATKTVGDIALPGAHQTQNAALAVAAAALLDDPNIDNDALRRGLAEATWPARLQRLDDGPLRALLPEAATLWVDGGHNEGAGRALGHWVADDNAAHTHLIVGMMQTKDATRFLQGAAATARHIHCVPVPGEERAFTAADLAEQAKSVSLPATAHDSIAAALKQVATDDPRARVLICGSLYLAGHVLHENGFAVT